MLHIIIYNVLRYFLKNSYKHLRHKMIYDSHNNMLLLYFIPFITITQYLLYLNNKYYYIGNKNFILRLVTG